MYQHKHGHFTTVTRVVAASPGGLPKVIISYALEASAQGEKDRHGAVEGRGTQEPHETEQTPSGHQSIAAGDVRF